MIHFDLAWTCPTLHRFAAQGPEAFLLSIAQEKPQTLQVSSTSQPPSSQKILETALKMIVDSEMDTSFSQIQLSTSPCSTTVAQSAAAQVDLHSVPNLCRHLKQRTEYTSTGSVPYAGYLQKSPTTKHLISPSSRPFKPAHMQTLDDVLVFANANPLKLLPADKIVLSKSLVAAVLQFHSTPWLKVGVFGASITTFDDRSFCS